MVGEKKMLQGKAVYVPEVYDVTSLEEAKHIILTPGTGTTTDERWEKETPFLIDQVGQYLKPAENSCLIDYGCGIGRMSKGLIERYGCSVIGVDISPSMRQYAIQYVDSARFVAVSPEMLDVMLEKGLQGDGAIAMWVLQHCLAPAEDVARIQRALKPEAGLYVLNNKIRAVPTDKGWYSDDIDICQILRNEFDTVMETSLPETVATPQIAEHTFIEVLKKRVA